MSISGTGMTIFSLVYMDAFYRTDEISAKYVYLCLCSVFSLHSAFCCLFSVLICRECSFTGMMLFLFRMKQDAKEQSCIMVYFCFVYRVRWYYLSNWLVNCLVVMLQ